MKIYEQIEYWLMRILDERNLMKSRLLILCALMIILHKGKTDCACFKIVWFNLLGQEAMYVL